MALERFGITNQIELEEAGSIVTDRYGLSTARCVFQWNGDHADIVSSIDTEAPINMEDPNLSLKHPYANYLSLEKRELVLSPGISRVICDFAGCQSQSASVYEYEAGLKEEDIRTHPSFPLLAKRHGIFTGVGEFNSGVTLYAQDYHSWWTLFINNEFTKFATYSPLGGVEAYMGFSHGLWKQTYTSPNRESRVENRLGCIETPPGNPPEFVDNEPVYRIAVPELTTTTGHHYYSWGDAYLENINFWSNLLGLPSRNWLYIGYNTSQRGSAFTTTHQWMLSGVGGWNPMVYKQGNNTGYAGLPYTFAFPGDDTYP